MPSGCSPPGRFTSCASLGRRQIPFTAYLGKSDLSKLSVADRVRTVRHTADQLNDLSFDERQKLQRSGATRRLTRYFGSLPLLALGLMTFASLGFFFPAST